MDYATFQATYANSNGTFSDNTTRAISEADLRQFASDILSSFAMSASSSLNATVFEIGDFSMANSGAQVIKSVYLGSSSIVSTVKFYGVEVRSDSDAILPDARYAVPYFIAGNDGPVLFSGGVLKSGASAVINIAASGTFSSGTDFDTASNYNRGYVTLFF